MANSLKGQSSIRPSKIWPGYSKLMFSGKKISIKKNLDQITAKKYQQAIIKAGLKAGVAPMPNTAPAGQKTTSIPAITGIAAATIAAAGSTMDNRPPPSTAHIDTSAYTMSEAGITLDETSLADEPAIDISALSMDKVGIIIDETPPAQAAEIDVSTISMQETGVDLMEYETPVEADYDLSEFSMAEAGEILVEHTATAPVTIDTSNLELK